MTTRRTTRKRGAAAPSTWPKGTRVSWHYRSAIGHGVIVRVRRLGASHAATEYAIRQTDHHPGEPAVVFHYGRALTRR